MACGLEETELSCKEHQRKNRREKKPITRIHATTRPIRNCFPHTQQRRGSMSIVEACPTGVGIAQLLGGGKGSDCKAYCTDEKSVWFCARTHSSSISRQDTHAHRKQALFLRVSHAVAGASVTLPLSAKYRPRAKPFRSTIT